VGSVAMGDRAAINLQGVDLEEVSRGSQLVTQNHFQPLKVLGAEVQLLVSSPHTIVQNQRIRIHLGTQEVMARIALVDQKILEPGEKGASVIRLESPLIAAYGDKFIIRQYSPVTTIGGGDVIETEMSGKWKMIKEKISKLNNIPPSDRLHHKVYQELARPIKKAEIGLRLGLSMEMINELVVSDIRLHWGNLKNNTWLLSDFQINELEIAIVDYLREYHKKNAYKVGAQKEEIRQSLHCEGAFLEFLLNNMTEKELIKSQGESWSLVEHNIQLSPEEKDIQDKLIEILDTEGFTSSRYDELASQIGYDKEKVKILLNISQQSGEILRLDGNLMFTRGNFDILKKKVNTFFKDAEVMSIPEFKNLAETSRKYAVPLLEYFDKLKITYRDNDGRKLVK
jgi:selenocysteine-specific elongation factor